MNIMSGMLVRIVGRKGGLDLFMANLNTADAVHAAAVSDHLRRVEEPKPSVDIF